MLKSKKISIGIIVVMAIIIILVLQNGKIVLTNKTGKEIRIHINNKTNYIKDIEINSSDEEIILSLENVNTKNQSGLLVYEIVDDKKILDKGIIHDDKTELSKIKLKSKKNEVRLQISYYNPNSDNSIDINGRLTIKQIKNQEYSTLLTGYDVNDKMKKMANSDLGLDSVAKDINIKKIKVTGKVDERFKTDDNIVSTKDSKEPIYMWYEGGTIYFSCNNRIKLNRYSSRLFSDLESLVDITDLKEMDTSEVENMSYFFWGDKSLSNIRSIGYFKTPNIKSLLGMFKECEMLTDISPLIAFDTRKVEDISELLFKSGVNNIEPLKYFSTAKLKKMFSAFEYTNIEDISSLENWDTSNVTTMFSAFAYTNVKDLMPLKNWKISKVDNLLGTFAETKIENVDGLKNWDVSNVKKIDYIFSTCINLKNIDGLSNWNIKSVEEVKSAFENTEIENVDALSKWDISKVKNLSCLFCGARKLKKIDGLSNWNTNSVTSLKQLFSHTSVESVTALSKWSVGNVTDLEEFLGYTKLKKIDGISKWDVSNVVNFKKSFIHTMLEDVDELSNWDTANGKDFSYMFSNTDTLKNVNGIENWNISSGENFEKLLYKTDVPRPNWNGEWNEYGSFTKR